MKYLLFFFILFNSSVAFSQKEIPVAYHKADSLYKIHKDEQSYNLLKTALDNVSSDSLRAEIWIRMGYIQGDANNIDSSLYFLKKAAELCAEKKLYYRLAKTYVGIGDRFLTKRNFQEADFYYQEGLKKAGTAGDSVKAYLSMLVLNLKKRKYGAAFSLVSNELAKYDKSKIPYMEFYSDQAKGNFYLSELRYDSALFYLKKAISETSESRLKANVYNDLAETCLALKQYDKSFAYQDSAARANDAEKAWENLIPFFDTYKNLYKEKGDYRRALYYADSARLLSDSLFDADKNNATIDAEAKYNNQKALADKALLEKERSIIQRNFIIALSGLAFIALLAFVSLRISRVRKKANTKLSAQKEEVQKLADELSAANETKARLFSTIGHDLRSPVSSLYALLKMEEIKGGSQGSEMSGHTVQLLDTLEELLVWSKSQMEGFVLQQVKINVQDLLEELQQFYAGAAQAKNVGLASRAQSIFIRTDENILKTILRNAISNAIAHTAEGNAVVLSAEAGSAGRAMISVKNPCSSQGFEQFKSSFENAAIKSSTHGFGIVLMKEFAQKINAEVLLSYEDDCAVLKIFV